MEMFASIDWLPTRSETLAARPVPLVPVAAAPNDEALMLRYQDGDDDAFATLYARHRGALLRFTRHLCHHDAEAEEIFQETWIAVVDARARYRPKAKFVTWLFAIAHRRAAGGHGLRSLR